MTASFCRIMAGFSWIFLEFPTQSIRIRLYSNTPENELRMKWERQNEYNTEIGKHASFRKQMPQKNEFNQNNSNNKKLKWHDYTKLWTSVYFYPNSLINGTIYKN